MLKEVLRWTNLGKSEIEQFVEDMTNGDIVSVEGYLIQDLLHDFQKYMKEHGLGSELLNIKEMIWPTRHYWLYYAYHAHPGLYTEFESGVDASGTYIRPILKHHEGGHLCAKASEIIILREA